MRFKELTIYQKFLLCWTVVSLCVLAWQLFVIFYWFDHVLGNICGGLCASDEEKIIIVNEGIKEKKTDLTRNRSSLGYQWNFIKENDKANYFKKILNSLGFKYTDQEIDTVIKKSRPVNDSRKHNERPKKGILNRKRR